MDKNTLQQGMSGITTRPRTTPKNVNKIQEEAKPSGERKVISIYIKDYDVLRKYAYENRCTLTEAVAAAVKTL